VCIRTSTYLCCLQSVSGHVCFSFPYLIIPYLWQTAYSVYPSIYLLVLPVSLAMHASLSSTFGRSHTVCIRLSTYLCYLCLCPRMLLFHLPLADRKQCVSVYLPTCAACVSGHACFSFPYLWQTAYSVYPNSYLFVLPAKCLWPRKLLFPLPQTVLRPPSHKIYKKKIIWHELS
jgi:hypothetical protein